MEIGNANKTKTKKSLKRGGKAVYKVVQHRRLLLLLLLLLFDGGEQEKSEYSYRIKSIFIATT